MEKKKPILLIVYNHNYEKNIDKLRKLYTGRFSRVWHLMPFYTGSDSDVIPVYQNSRQFQGFFAQAFRTFYREDVSHYLFVADDLLLNPRINENNYQEYFQIDSDQSFVPEMRMLHTVKGMWMRILDAVQYNPEIKGIEAKNLLPSKDAVDLFFARHGLTFKPISVWSIYGAWRLPTTRAYVKTFLSMLWYWITRSRSGKVLPRYPVVGGYSDLVIVDAKSIHAFTHYCGIFAATNMFVELAIPTALAMSATNIITEAHLSRTGASLWSLEEKKTLEPFQGSLVNLINKFPQSVLYYHPIKLSEWKTS